MSLAQPLHNRHCAVTASRTLWPDRLHCRCFHGRQAGSNVLGLRNGQKFRDRLVKQQLAAEFEFLAAVAVGKKAIVADALEAGLERMQ